MNYHYYIIELTLPVITGACTINGNPGYGTPLTCVDQSETYTPVDYIYKFSDANLILDESGIFRCVKSVSETTPKLKAGNGVASRATATIQLADFIGDPNPDCLAITDPTSGNPAILNQGTFFGKLKARNIITNKYVNVKYYKRDESGDSLVSTHNYIATDLKQGNAGNWSLICKDILYKADDTKSQFPKINNNSLNGSVPRGNGGSGHIIDINGDLSEWDATKHVAIVGDEIMLVTAVNATSLTVTRGDTITLGSRTITNNRTEHDNGDEVFRGRKFVNADLYDVIEAVFLDAGLLPSQIDTVGMQADLDVWLDSVAGDIDCIFYEPSETASVLDKICQTFLLDIWTDTSAGKVTLKATSPWDNPTAKLVDGIEIIYNTMKVDEPESLQYSRAFIQYDKRRLTSNDDDVNFTRGSLAFNGDYEGDLFYGEEKVKRLPKSIILSNKNSNIDSAQLTVNRYAQRFSYRPKMFKFDIEEQNLNFNLADVVVIETDENQYYNGLAKSQENAQITSIIPKYNNGRYYSIEATTYNAFAGGIIGTDFNVPPGLDLNSLFVTAGGPSGVVDTFTFIFDGQYGQGINAQTLAVGNFAAGSIVNIILINDAIITARGGDGGYGQDSDPNGFQGSAGLDGGTTLVCTSGVTTNIYLGGTVSTYTASGRLYAPGGGGGGGRSSYTVIDPGTFYGVGGGGGGAGAGYPSGAIGLGGAGEDGGADGEDGQVASIIEGGAGGLGGRTPHGGDGGDSGNDGDAGYIGAGTAGKALILNGATVNIYTDGNIARFKQGSGDAPNSIS